MLNFCKKNKFPKCFQKGSNNPGPLATVLHMIYLQKESGQSTQKVNFRIKETKKISVLKKCQNRLYKVGLWMKFFQMKIIKGHFPSKHSHCAFQACKRDCERVIGEGGEIATVSGSL